MCGRRASGAPSLSIKSLLRQSGSRHRRFAMACGEKIGRPGSSERAAQQTTSVYGKLACQFSPVEGLARQAARIRQFNHPRSSLSLTRVRARGRLFASSTRQQKGERERAHSSLRNIANQSSRALSQVIEPS